MASDSDKGERLTMHHLTTMHLKNAFPHTEQKSLTTAHLVKPLGSAPASAPPTAAPSNSNAPSASPPQGSGDKK